jgi:DNA-binding NtrC family response regulator
VRTGKHGRAGVSACPRRDREVGWQANVGEFEKALVVRALRQAEGNKSKAAELLGIHRRLLYEKMREFGIE